jgi:hypothetical protein
MRIPREIIQDLLEYIPPGLDASPILQRARAFVEIHDPEYQRQIHRQPFFGNVLDQTVWWLPRGSHHWERIDGLDRPHQVNLLRYLRRNAARYYLRADMEYCGVLGPFPRGEMAQDQALASMEQAAEEFLEKWPDPQVWLEHRPLVKRLSELVSHGGDDDRSS